MKKERTLLLFPNDPLQAYIKKGEVKTRYYNPGDFFNRILVVNYSSNELTKKEKQAVQDFFGSAEVRIFTMGTSSNAKKLLLNRLYVKKILKFCKDFKVDCVRAYGVWAEGLLAMRSAKKLRVPYVISLHTNYDDYRYQIKQSGAYVQYLLMRLLRPMERKILKNATHILPVYTYAKRYAVENKANTEKITVIHNKVFKDQFYPSTRKFDGTLRVINVSNMNWFKNQGNLIRALKGLEGKVHLTLVGQGPDLENHKRLAEELAVKQFVTFIPKIENSRLRDEYVKNDVFAHAIRIGGVGIPVLEAMACGLAIVHSIYFDEENPEILPEVALRVENSPEGFRNAFKKLLSDQKLLSQLSSKALEASKEYSGTNLEQQEHDVYAGILGVS